MLCKENNYFVSYNDLVYGEVGSVIIIFNLKAIITYYTQKFITIQ